MGSIKNPHSEEATGPGLVDPDSAFWMKIEDQWMRNEGFNKTVDDVVKEGRNRVASAIDMQDTQDSSEYPNAAASMQG